LVAIAGALEGGARLFVDLQSLPLLATPMAGNSNLETASQIFAYDSHLFWRLRPNLRLPVLPDGAAWGAVTNSTGLRMARELDHDDTRQRVLCVGDSCTYGLGCSVADAWPTRLDDEFDAVNAGVPGYSSFQTARWCAEIAPKIRPRCVVAQVGVNDAMTWPTWQHGRVVTLSDHDRAIHVELLDLATRSRFLGWLMSAFATPHPFEPVDPYSGDAVVRVSSDECAANLRAICRAAPSAVIVAWPARKLLAPGFGGGGEQSRRPFSQRAMNWCSP